MRAAALAALVLAALVLAGTGCDGGSESGATTDGATTDGAPPAETALGIYLVRGELLAPVRRRVAATPAVARAALEQLLAGPTAEERAAGYGTLVPAGTRLLDVAVADGVATVDLSGDFASGGGSLSMLLRVAQVVYTATRFPAVDRVAFRLDGEPVDAIGGEGVSVSPPVGRETFEGQAPLILVEDPLPGDAVTAPLRVRGSANVFEATVSLEVVDDEGGVLADTFTTATSGTGTRGTFATAIGLPEASAGPVRLTAYESSAKDGSRLHVVTVPLELVP